MKMYVFFKNGTVLDFEERHENQKWVNDLFKLALRNKSLMCLPCSNGDFLINPDEIAYIHVLPDQPLEPDQMR